MHPQMKRIVLTVFLAAIFLLAGAGGGDAWAESARAARKNPCAANPCAAKNPCAANPCAAKNPCAVNPCTAKQTNVPIRKYRMTDQAAVMKLGEKLWHDTKLGTSGTSCSTCHPGGALLKSTPWPKYIGMADDILTLDQMINFCMKNPMKGKPLGWNSQKMTALAAYVTANSGGGAGGAGGANPCAVNPCNP